MYTITFDGCGHTEHVPTSKANRPRRGYTRPCCQCMKLHMVKTVTETPSASLTRLERQVAMYRAVVGKNPSSEQIGRWIEKQGAFALVKE